MIWGYDLSIFRETGLKIPIRHDLSTHCHALVTGSSGSGKSYALLFLLGMLLKDSPDVDVYFCDFKNSEDFAFLEGYEHYYSGNACYDGIIAYYDSFTKARENRVHTKKHILIIDEYPSFINYLQGQDKRSKTKYANDILSVVSEVLMLGRGISYYVWLTTQRADNTLFANGSRDNFMVIIGLGKMSREQKGMIFTGEDIPDCIYQKGEGLLLADGSALTEVKFPLIKGVAEWKKHIKAILFRSGRA